MAKINLKKEPSVDVLILHGMSDEIVNDLKFFFKSLELTAETVLNLGSQGRSQNDRVNYQIKNCGIPLILATFDEEEGNATKARINIYDEIARSQTFRPKDTIVLREISKGKKVKIQSNVEGHLIILEFDRLKLHNLYSQLITELKSRNVLTSKQRSDVRSRISMGGTLNKFFDQMDKIWEEEFDVASDKIDRHDWFTENKFMVTLDKFFVQYWVVIDALVRKKQSDEELKMTCENALEISLKLAAEVWESVADAKMKTIEDLKNKRNKDKKFDNHGYEVYYNKADIEMRNAKKKQETAQNKIASFRKALENLNLLIRRVV